MKQPNKTDKLSRPASPGAGEEPGANTGAAYPAAAYTAAGAAANGFDAAGAAADAAPLPTGIPANGMAAADLLAAAAQNDPAAANSGESNANSLSPEKAALPGQLESKPTENSADTQSADGPAVQADASPAAQYADPKRYPEAPFSYRMAESESVSLADGSLECTFTDFTLPGRNGFDLTIARRYDSNNANLYEMTPEAYDGGVRTVRRENFHNFRQYGLGYGWQFVLPSVEIVPESQRRAGVSYAATLHLEDGRHLALENGRLQEYSLLDVQAEAVSGTLTHPCRTGESRAYQLRVSYKDGRADYFARCSDADGRLDCWRLCARTDRFGNAIFFTLHDGGGMTVIDSWGRTLTLQRTGSDLRWSLPDGSALRYLFEDVPTGRRLLGVVDEMARATWYAYYDPTVYSAVSQVANAAHGDTAQYAFTYQLLKKITHPTGGVTCYEYAAPGAPLQLTVNDLGGVRRYFPLKKRFDRYADSEAEPQRSAVSYAYTLAGSGKYICRTQVTRGDAIAEQHHFDADGQLTRSEISHAGQLRETVVYTYGTQKTAPDYRQIIRTVRTQYADGRSLTHTTQTAYTADKKRDIASLRETWAEAPQLDSLTQYRYGSFGQQLEKSYPQSDGVTIREVCTLRADGKAVETAAVYANDALQQLTRYEYGSAGAQKDQVVKEHRLYARPGEALSAESPCYTRLFAYADGCAQPVSVIQTGLTDADGAALPDVTERFAYDLRGSRTRAVDGLGNATEYQYNAAGEPVCETLPPVDGVRHTRTRAYDAARNYIVLTDENGARLRAQYTPLGQLQAVYFALRDYPTPGDIPAVRYEYDVHGRRTAETVLEGDAAGTPRRTVRYTYDSFDRVLEKRILSPDGGELYREAFVYTDLYRDPDAGMRCVNRTQKTVFGAGPDAPDLQTVTDTDPAGRTVKEMTAGICRALYEYDKLDNRTVITDIQGTSVHQSFDWAGRWAS